MEPSKLQDHIYQTYFWLRIGLCALAFLFPILLLIIGWWKVIPPQASMSAYYFAFDPPTSELRDFPGRTVFVGILFVLGFFLMLYKGFSNTENWALNIAGFAAVLVALFPMHTPDYCKNCGGNTLAFVHGAAAITLFVCIAFVAWACTEETLVRLPEAKREWFRNSYYGLAALMIIAPISAVIMTAIFGIYDKKVFFVEWVGIATFSVYWGLKSYELSLSQAEKKAMSGVPVSGDGFGEGSSLRKKAARMLD